MSYQPQRKHLALILLVLLTGLMAYFTLVHKIGSYCIQLWDESRNASNAVEMNANGHWFVRYFEGKPDTWELKPPFLIWLQVAGIRLFGYNELAIRFPGMVFSVLTVLLVVITLKKVTGNWVPGCIAAMILVSTPGYVGDHVARTGDHDAALVFFSTLAVVSWFLYLESDKRVWLFTTFLAFLLGWFTKSIAVFMMVPALGIYTVVKGKTGDVLKRKVFWLTVGMLFGLIAAYYIYREQITPGYWQQVWMNEMFGRYFDVSGEYRFKKESYWYYLAGFVNGRYQPFIALMVLAPFFLFRIKDRMQRSFRIYLVLVMVIFLSVISFGTKNFWYDAPIFPLGAMVFGMLIHSIYHHFKNAGLRIAWVFVCTLLMAEGYRTTFWYAFNPDPAKHDDWRNLCYFLRDHRETLPDDLWVVQNSYFSPYYLYAADAGTRGQQIRFQKTTSGLSGKAVLMTDPVLIRELEARYHVSLTDSARFCRLYQVADSIRH